MGDEYISAEHLFLAALTLVGADWLVAYDDLRSEPQIVQATVISSEAVEAEVGALA